MTEQCYPLQKVVGTAPLNVIFKKYEPVVI